jgi:hypothetical protein
MATPLFNKPSQSSKIARQIWEEAGLPAAADELTIREALDIWTVSHAHVYEKSDLCFHIQWVSSDGYIIHCNYTAFQNWILCAATVATAAPTTTVPVNIKEPKPIITIDDTTSNSDLDTDSA